MRNAENKTLGNVQIAPMSCFTELKPSPTAENRLTWLTELTVFVTRSGRWLVCALPDAVWIRAWTTIRAQRLQVSEPRRSLPGHVCSQCAQKSQRTAAGPQRTTFPAARDRARAS